MTYIEFKNSRDHFTVDEYANAKTVEELEKIKEECEDLIQFHGKRTDDYGIGKIEAYKHIIEFVNERIAKLKGENNE